MAAAEARTAWQRTANRCFVQEDAKRAPKLACCTSPPCPQQNESSEGSAKDEQDQHAPNFMPLNWKPTNSNLPPEIKWWLQLQPNFVYQKNFPSEQLNAVEDKLEEAKAQNTTFCKSKEEHLGDLIDNDSKNYEYPFEPPRMVSTAFMKHASERGVDEVKMLTNNSHQIFMRKVDMGVHFYHDEEAMYCKSVDEKPDKGFSDLETPWPTARKSEPWWRIVDKDELASLVAHKSLQHIENCDLPRPTQISREPFSCLEGLESNRIFSASVGRNSHAGVCNPVATGYKDRPTSEQSHSSSDTDKFSSCACSVKDSPESRATLESDPSRAQLLEALRHSQTRAREAEMAAQKAYNENGHIVSLLFRQASHLFAYKQWLHMLQLESLCLQLKLKDLQTPILSPVLPRMPPLKGKASKKVGKKQKCSLCKYVVFVLGLGLAGAGLLLGWTLGWLLPSF